MPLAPSLSKPLWHSPILAAWNGGDPANGDSSLSPTPSSSGDHRCGCRQRRRARDRGQHRLPIHCVSADCVNFHRPGLPGRQSEGTGTELMLQRPVQAGVDADPAQRGHRAAVVGIFSLERGAVVSLKRGRVAARLCLGPEGPTGPVAAPAMESTAMPSSAMRPPTMKPRGVYLSLGSSYP